MNLRSKKFQNQPLENQLMDIYSYALDQVRSNYDAKDLQAALFYAKKLQELIDDQINNCDFFDPQ